jgi:hypothetical protein
LVLLYCNRLNCMSSEALFVKGSGMAAQRELSF